MLKIREIATKVQFAGKERILRGGKMSQNLTT